MRPPIHPVFPPKMRTLFIGVASGRVSMAILEMLMSIYIVWRRNYGRRLMTMQREPKLTQEKELIIGEVGNQK